MSSKLLSTRQIATNKTINSPSYTLDLEKQPTIFKQGLVTKKLEALQENSTKERLCTIKCTQPFCGLV